MKRIEVQPLAECDGCYHGEQAQGDLKMIKDLILAAVKFESHFIQFKTLNQLFVFFIN